MKDNQWQDFMRHYVPVQTALRRFVFAHVPDYHQAEDAFQEVVWTLMRKFKTYDPSRKFAPWAFGVAWKTVLKSRRSAARSKLVYTEAVREQIAETLADQSADLDRKRRFLADCRARLPENHLRILEMKYEERKTTGAIAKVTGRTALAIRVLLCRIRQALADCVNSLSVQDNAEG